MQAGAAQYRNHRITSSLGMAHFGFFLLFPGFFVYQTLIGMGAMSAYLGGYFAVVSIALVVPLGLTYCTVPSDGKSQLTLGDLGFGLFLTYFLAIVLLNAVFGANGTIIRTHLLSILYFFNIYLIFKNIDLSGSKAKFLSQTSLVLMSSLILFYARDGSFNLGYLGDPKSPESVATYQGFARSYVVTFVVVLACTSSILARVALYGVAVVALFLIGSRSELVAVVLLIPVVELYRARNGLHMITVVLLVVSILWNGPKFMLEIFPDSRVWELFDLSHSQSANARHDLTQRALRTIAEHPVLGDYGSYPPGEYAHNILSAWVDLGFFGFVYMLTMLLRTAIILLTQGRSKRQSSDEALLAWSLVFIALFLLFTAKNFDDMFTGAAMGAFACYCRRNNRRVITTGESHYR
jgi:hypothetical protein